ncbi:hypothetical protein BH18ACI5_BH18ACI5_04320 [soil metagenome]
MRAIERELTDADIQWELGSLPTAMPEDGDLLTAMIIEAQSYRQIAQQAIHALHALQRELMGVRARYYERRDAGRTAGAS